MKTYSIEFKTSATKELKKLPRSIQAKILDSMRLLAANPYSQLLPIRKMEASGSRDLYRMRVADYRVIYEIQKDLVIIFVIRIGHRKDVYR